MRYAKTIAGLMLALLALTYLKRPLSGLPSLENGWRPGFATRQALEVAVMALQVGGVLALLWLKVAPASTPAACSLMAAQLGLGVSGSLCAAFESGFALFAGATLIVLLLGAMVETGTVDPFHLDPDRRPVAAFPNV